jgi:formiminoglutamase
MTNETATSGTAAQALPNDPRWPRAQTLLKPIADALAATDGPLDAAILGIPAHLTSISPTNAHTTPAAIREALLRYSTWSWQHRLDLAALNVGDAGDIIDPDGEAGEARTIEAVAGLREQAGLVIGLGGDNSVTYAMGVGSLDLATSGLITFDAHHDIRDGINNGSPVKRLIAAGLDPRRIVQIGIADYSNSPEYAMEALDLGITVIPRSELRNREASDVIRQALAIAGSGGGSIHVDIDVDVCDRSVVPACPAAAPGGISADQLREFAYLVANDKRVVSIDLTEIDASIDAPDGRTVRLAALLILEILAGRF